MLAWPRLQARLLGYKGRLARAALPAWSLSMGCRSSSCLSFNEPRALEFAHPLSLVVVPGVSSLFWIGRGPKFRDYPF